MMRTHVSRLLRSTILPLAALSLTRCTGGRDDGSIAAPDGFSAAKGGGGAGPTVSATDPAYGKQGALAYRVTITGSGFEPGAVAAWERGGAADPKITVRSTEYVSSTQLVATIDIAPDADVAFYDVSVTALGGSKGIGTEAFEVTQATSIGTLDGNTLARGVNSRGQITGYSMMGSDMCAFYWDPETRTMVPIGPAGSGWAIDELGTTIVGVSSSHATVWVRAGDGWQRTALPRDPSADISRASSVASDPITGTAILIGGNERLPAGDRPRVWTKTETGWEKVVLPMPITDAIAWVEDVNANGQAVGVVRTFGGKQAGTRAVLWERGASGWTARIIGPLGSGAQGISSSGNLVVGAFNGIASYLQRVDGSWSGPHQLPGSCAHGMDVDDEGRIVASRCPVGSRLTGAVFHYPYSSPFYLGGLGDQTEGGTVEAISPRGGWIVGNAPTRPAKVGVVWNPFAF